MTSEGWQSAVSYNDAVIADNPIGYWHLGEPSGSTATDAMGNGYDGTYTNTVTLGAAGLVVGTDTAMSIDTLGSGYVDGPTLTGTTVTGIEAWFETGTSSNHRYIASLHLSRYDRAIITHKSDGYVGVWSDMTGWFLTSDGVVSSNAPHHVAVWYESGTNTTYMMIDGVTQQNTYTGNLLAVVNPRVDIGAYRYKSRVYPKYLGSVDEVAIYNSAVSSATFSSHYSAGAIGGGSGNDFAYDANGNRTSLDDGSNVTTFGYQALTNQLTSIDSAAVTLDAVGNLIAAASGARTYSYDDTNRLDEVFDNSVLTASYVHNALGQRIKKTVGSADTIYLYDLNGGLLAEHDGTGVLIRDYVRLNGTPVAQIDQGEVVSYLHFDHLGTPRLATDDSQAVVWRWDGDAFGAVLPDQDPDGNGASVTVNLRFAGQYYDVESGLNYNYFRTYDPSTGRYLESDPIGINGGLNSYGYVGGNPLTFYDPYGLFGMDDIFGAIYDATGGYSPSQGLVDGVAGFGDAFLISKLVRDAYDIGSVDQCSTAYGRGKVAGVVAGSIPFAARGAAWLGGTRFGHVLNHNRWFRIGPGRWGKDMIPRIASPYLPGSGHFSLLTRLPLLPPVGALSDPDCECSK